MEAPVHSLPSATTTTTTTTTTNTKPTPPKRVSRFSLHSVDPALWIREDCRAFYHEHLKPTTHCSKRARLIRVSIHQAYQLLINNNNNNNNNRERESLLLLFLEYGVHRGNDMARMASLVKALDDTHRHYNNRTILHGFDSFEGLPEDWHNGQYTSSRDLQHAVGTFDCQGQCPDLNDRQFANSGGNHNNVVFHKGWFQDTVEPFFDSYNNQKIAFVHADADLYSSTKTFLDAMCRRKLFLKGTVILFDEYWNYEGWQDGEHRAWMEAVATYGIDFRYLAIHAMTSAPTGDSHETYRGYQSVCVLIQKDMPE